MSELYTGQLSEVLRQSVICVWVRLTPDESGLFEIFTVFLVKADKENFIKATEEEFGPIRIEYWETVMDIFTLAMKTLAVQDTFEDYISKIE